MIKFFKLRQLSLVCPDCETVFASFELARTPPVERNTPVETDLHRVLPDPELRAALLATCPNCLYTWWLSSFSEHHFLPQLVPDAPPLEPSKKFAHAVQTGRKKNVHFLDRGVLALNGYWCSREEGKDGEKFLKLAKLELTSALADETWFGNRPRYNYILAEVLRLSGEFAEADKYYQQVKGANLPREMVEKMRSFAASGNKAPVRLPPHLVEEIFVPKAAIGA